MIFRNEINDAASPLVKEFYDIEKLLIFLTENDFYFVMISESHNVTCNL